ncbi:hypothetical protein EV128_13726 [Rhizobium azibense]|nr:hypothetical protein EV128_13726 [Rhizobium azibense]
MPGRNGVARPDQQALPVVSDHRLPSQGVHLFWWTSNASEHSTAKGAGKFALTQNLSIRIFKLSRTPFGSDAFSRTRGDVGRADGAGGRAIGAASTTGTKADGAQGISGQRVLRLPARTQPDPVAQLIGVHPVLERKPCNVSGKARPFRRRSSTA